MRPCLHVCIGPWKPIYGVWSKTNAHGEISLIRIIKKNKLLWEFTGLVWADSDVLSAVVHLLQKKKSANLSLAMVRMIPSQPMSKLSWEKEMPANSTSLLDREKSPLGQYVHCANRVKSWSDRLMLLPPVWTLASFLYRNKSWDGDSDLFGIIIARDLTFLVQTSVYSFTAGLSKWQRKKQQWHWQ